MPHPIWRDIAVPIDDLDDDGLFVVQHARGLGSKLENGVFHACLGIDDCDDYLFLIIHSAITPEERMRKFGVPGIRTAEGIEKEIQARRVWLGANSPDVHRKEARRAELAWWLPSWRHGDPVALLNEFGRQVREFCEKGDFVPVVPDLRYGHHVMVNYVPEELPE